MKLVIVIVSNKDLTNVLSSTVEEGYFSTKISTQGMFLENGQTTVLFGVKDEEVDDNTFVKSLLDTITITSFII